MAKIMLVEDDNNLREIYEARLLAEGYEIVSASDGEEALAMAVKEKPDLIISDIMMPKVSGFDMLDILRSTPETKDTKIIMMTALSQAEDKARADKLGADKYLVKSQVTLEDVAKITREVLDGESTSSSPLTDQPTPAAAPAPAATAKPPKADPTTQAPPAVDPVVVAPSTTTPAPTQSSTDEEAVMDKQIKSFISNPTPAAPPAVDPPTDKTSAVAANADHLATVVNQIMNDKKAEAPKPAETAGNISGKKIIQPINDIVTAKPNLEELVAKEQAKEIAQSPGTPTVINPVGGTEQQSPSNKPDPNKIAL